MRCLGSEVRMKEDSAQAWARRNASRPRCFFRPIPRYSFAAVTTASAERSCMPVAHSHQPTGYRCPFCRVAAGEDLRDNFTKQTDVVFRDSTLTAFVSSARWPANPGNVLI